MIRTDKKNKNYVWVDYTDIIHAISFANKEKNQLMIDLLNDKFLNMDVQTNLLNKKSMFKLKKSDKVYTYLKDCPLVEDYDTLINVNILKDALIRAYYEFNYEKKKKLSKYFRLFIDNEIRGIDNKLLIDEILNDKELLEYIKKYENFNEYIEDKINRNIQNDNIMYYDKNKEKIKNKDKYVA